VWVQQILHLRMRAIASHGVFKPAAHIAATADKYQAVPLALQLNIDLRNIQADIQYLACN